MSFVYEENSRISKNGRTYYKSQNTEKISDLNTINLLKVSDKGDDKRLSYKTNNIPFKRLRVFILEAFFPEGYPESVSNDYLTYQAWDTVQAFASSISGSLATKAVLEGVGVGDESATSLAATITWLLRQGAGMIGQILFTWIQGSDLDHNCKRWRLFADILNDTAMCLELSGPLWPSFILQFVLCIASVARSLVGVAGGATRTAITQHQAKAGNISDVAAKDGSQETLVNLVALMLNLMVLPLVAENMALTWSLFFCLTILHLYANFKAVSSLCFETLNKDRLIMVLQSYNFNDNRYAPSPKLINKKENVFIGFGLSEKDLFQHLSTHDNLDVKINIGVSLEKIVNNSSGYMAVDSGLIRKLREELRENKFSIWPSVIGRNNHEYNIILAKGFDGSDLLHAYYVAYRMAIELLPLNYHSFSDLYKEDFHKFRQKLVEAGWKIGQLQLNTQGFAGNFVE